MNLLDFYGSKVEEDPQNFVAEVFKILIVMEVSLEEKVELYTYRLKYVAQIWYEKKNRTVPEERSRKI